VELMLWWQSRVSWDRMSQRRRGRRARDPVRRRGVTPLGRRRRASARVSRMPANAATGKWRLDAAEQDSEASRRERPGPTENHRQT
jgi:hypothetical protein